MEECKISKEQILKEVEKALDLYGDDDLTSCGYELQMTYKTAGIVTIKKNLYVNSYWSTCGCGGLV